MANKIQSQNVNVGAGATATFQIPNTYSSNVLEGIAIYGQSAADNNALLNAFASFSIGANRYSTDVPCIYYNNLVQQSGTKNYEVLALPVMPSQNIQIEIRNAGANGINLSIITIWQ